MGLLIIKHLIRFIVPAIVGYSDPPKEAFLGDFSRD